MSSNTGTTQNVVKPLTKHSTCIKLKATVVMLLFQQLACTEAVCQPSYYSHDTVVTHELSTACKTYFYMNRSGALSVRWLVQTSLVAQRLVAFNDNDFKAHQAISIPTEHEATIAVRNY